MGSINKGIVGGRLGSDPKAYGDVVKFSVATNKKIKNKEVTNWFTVACFGTLGEIATKYLKKGSEVYVEGEMNLSKYVKDGVEKVSFEIIANDLQMFGKKQE